MTVPVPLTNPTLEQIRAFANALNPTIGPFGRDVVVVCDALRTAVDIASEAVGRLGKIGDIYAHLYAGDLRETEAWGKVEVALRGAPPEGDIAFYVLAERLAAVRELVDLGEKP